MGLFLPFVYNLLFAALLFSRPSVQIRLRNETQSCPNPVTPITVVNFEYSEGLAWANGGAFNSYHGITWRGWSGFKRYLGYPTGYSPIPSNYTTLVGGSAGNDTKVLEFGEFLVIGGPIQGVHSLWFNYLENNYTKLLGVESSLLFEGLTEGSPVTKLEVWVDPASGWHSLCLNFTGQYVNGLRITLPECKKAHNCSSSSIEIDDVWLGRNSW